MTLEDCGNQRPMFSIITATKNSAQTIRVLVECLQNQEFKDFEHIVIDGKSEDETVSIIRELANYQLKIISEPDSGLYFAMNKGLSLASGTYVSFLNSDDFYFPDTLKKVYIQAIKSGSRSVIYGGIADARNLGLKYFLNSHTLLDFEMIPHPATFIPRAAAQDVGPMNTNFKVAADYEWVMRLRKAGYGFEQLHAPLAAYADGGFSSNHVVRSTLETLFIQIRYGKSNKASAVLLFLKSLGRQFLTRIQATMRKR